MAPDLATVLVARHDRIFPAHTGKALHRHWQGSRLVVSNAGHVTSALFDDLVHVRAVVEGFRRARVGRRGERGRHAQIAPCAVSSSGDGDAT